VCLTLCYHWMPHLLLQQCVSPCAAVVCLTFCYHWVPHLVLQYCASYWFTILCLPCATVVCLTLCCSSVPHIVLQYCTLTCVNKRNRFRTIDQSLVTQMKQNSYTKRLHRIRFTTSCDVNGCLLKLASWNHNAAERKKHFKPWSHQSSQNEKLSKHDRRMLDCVRDTDVR
jgi:hypothetical protein